ncbi:Kunitz/Bovine pancreatic trypsin inhibitor domain protein [Cooperia oncophora]
MNRLLLALLPLVTLAFAQKECFLVKDSGFVCDAEAGQRFYFDMHTKRCQPFYYKGCGGNENAFTTREECTKKCSDVKGSTSTQAVCKSGAYAAGATSLPEPLDCSECPKGYVCEDKMCCPTRDYLCNLQYDAGKFGDKGSHTPR